MRNNLLSGTVGGFVGTVLNTPYVPWPISPACIFTNTVSGLIVRS